MSESEDQRVPTGDPLAICVRNCLLDHNQPQQELATICFHVRCAYAEKRWGRAEDALPQPQPFMV